jgi:DNA-binding GntR family transcriptional regulator
MSEASPSRRPKDALLDGVRPVLRGAPTAVWQQLRADLLGRIQAGVLRPGDELPSETALADAYRVSRLTMRRVLADLVRAGAIRTEHGVGSFVTAPVIRHRVDDGHASLVESMANRGHTVRQLVLDVRRTDSTADPLADPSPVPDFTDFPGPVVEYRYVRWLDDLPWSVSFAAIPAAIAPAAWDGSNSLFATISQAHDLQIRRNERYFSAIPAGPEEASWLEVPLGAPLLSLRGTNTDHSGRVVAYIVHRVRGDRAEYAVRIPE